MCARERAELRARVYLWLLHVCGRVRGQSFNAESERPTCLPASSAPLRQPAGINLPREGEVRLAGASTLVKRVHGHVHTLLETGPSLFSSNYSCWILK